MFRRSVSGTSSTYVEGVDKVTGRGKYTFDLDFPGMLVGKFLYPDYPRARITRLDTSAAESLPGVYAVVTHRDVPGEKQYGYVEKDQPVFAINEVHYVGDIVAAVAAIDEETAERALEAIEVEYMPLEGIYDPLIARQPGATPARSDLESNILSHQPVICGDPEQGFADADVIVEHTYRTGAIEQLCMETEGTVARWDGETITIYTGGQHPHRDRIQIAEQLGLPANRVRVVYPYIGGGFGAKDELDTQVQVALLAMKCGRPVKLIRTRSESFATHVKRQAFWFRYKTGAKLDGTITAIEVEAVLDAGPYTNASAPVAGFAAEFASGPYKVPNARINSYSVATNNLVGGAMRGFGGPETAYAQEQNLDIVARELGMDPLELRLHNAMEKDTLMPSGAYIYHEIGLKKTIRQAAAAARWQERESWLERQPAPHLRRGLGVATTFHGLSIGMNLMDYSRVALEMAPDGSVILLSGTAEIGSGARTAQLMIAADALGVNPEDIQTPGVDSDYVPDAGPTVASRSTYMVGNAVLQAAEPIRKSLFEVASEELEAAIEDLVIEGGNIMVVGAPSSRQVTVREAARKAWETNRPLKSEGHTLLWQPEEPVAKFNYPVPHTIFAYATHIVQVLVDVETGQVRVEKVWAAHDVGRAINMLGILGQVHGGIMQAIGTALTEELNMEDGLLLNPSLESYLVPTALEMVEIEPIILETPEPSGPFGAVGIGESTLNPTAAAIANAVDDAVGVRTWEIPMTPERILQAMYGNPEETSQKSS